MNPEMLQDPIFITTAIFAVLITGISKGGLGGLGLFAVPILSLSISPVQAAGIMLPILVVMDWIGVWARPRERRFCTGLRRHYRGALPDICGAWSKTSDGRGLAQRQSSHGMALWHRCWFYEFCGPFIPYAMLGQFDKTNLTTSAALIPLAPIGVLIGVWLVKRINQIVFYRIIYGLIFITGLKLLWDVLV